MLITNPFFFNGETWSQIGGIAKGKKSVVNATVLVAILSPDLP